VSAPAGCDAVTWKRQRVLQAAEHYIGLPYQHHHVPQWNPSSAWSGAEGPGLDCSNFTAWAYNFGLGMHFTSDVVAQADGAQAPGRVLATGEAFEPGDILFITDPTGATIAHAVIFVDSGHIIDDTGPGVQIRPFTGWYQQRYSHARRMIE
jgi:cell wall-associated NlpC family hydrolase